MVHFHESISHINSKQPKEPFVILWAAALSLSFGCNIIMRICMIVFIFGYPKKLRQATIEAFLDELKRFDGVTEFQLAL